MRASAPKRCGPFAFTGRADYDSIAGCGNRLYEHARSRFAGHGDTATYRNVAAYRHSNADRDTDCHRDQHKHADCYSDRHADAIPNGIDR